MKEENLNNCRSLITRDPNMIPPNSPLSYFISITIPQPKIRIKIPKLLVKTMQRRNNHKCNNADDFDQSKNKKKWDKPRRYLRRKFGSIIHNVFGNKKSQETCSSNCDGFRQCIQENEIQIMKEVEENNDQKDLNCGDEPIPLEPPDSEISKSHLLKEILEIENEKGKQEMIEDGKSSQQSDMADKQPLKMCLSLFIKGKMNKAYNCGSTCSKRGDKSGNGVGSSYRVIGKQENSNNFSRVPSRRSSGSRKIRRVKSSRKKATKQVEEESEQEGEELCKKRILMGDKCRPLNLSGVLHYDENGILLPEAIPM